MKLLLKKFDALKERTGVRYLDAKEALEECEGNVVDALIYLEAKVKSEGGFSVWFKKVVKSGQGALAEISQATKEHHENKKHNDTQDNEYQYSINFHEKDRRNVKEKENLNIPKKMDTKIVDAFKYKQSTVHELKICDKVEIIREPNNKYDNDGIAIQMDSQVILDKIFSESIVINEPKERDNSIKDRINDLEFNYKHAHVRDEIMSNFIELLEYDKEFAYRIFNGENPSEIITYIEFVINNYTSMEIGNVKLTLLR